MKFEKYEPNGNIKELRWKVTNRAPKYYTHANGNLEYDSNKGLNLQYNFLNLPKQLGQMSLVYDAIGRKWFKYGEFGTTSAASSITMASWRRYTPRMGAWWRSIRVVQCEILLPELLSN
ncbi:MAG: hypothetical protein H6557_00610 [Lewinellaceae bacterium]|nr:hypothetical protein [Phaeodactylibacter sp.]MCB9035100.1 hypothetical protein [Lewinellaceae bacterium]